LPQGTEEISFQQITHGQDVEDADKIGFICLNNRGRRKALRRGLLDEILQAWNDLKNRKIAASASRQKIRGKQQ
jgi:enoyl-CoA hydratase/carnithine racemase